MPSVREFVDWDLKSCLNQVSMIKPYERKSGHFVPNPLIFYTISGVYKVCGLTVGISKST